MKKFKRLALRAKGIFPNKLPTGGSEFDRFVLQLLEAYGFPTSDDYKHTIATMIMHLDPLTTHKSLRYFAKAIRKSQANQVAYAKIQEIKEMKAAPKEGAIEGPQAESTSEEMVRTS